MDENKQTNEDIKIEPALLTIPQVCEYLNIARATFYKINATGAFGLLPIKLGNCRKVLYLRSELEDWLKAKCPHRKQWQEHRRGKYCFGKTPMQTFLDSIPLVREKMLNNTLQTERVCLSD